VGAGNAGDAFTHCVCDAGWYGVACSVGDAKATCENNKRDGQESGVDCGGGVCDACQGGYTCGSSGDCGEDGSGARLVCYTMAGSTGGGVCLAPAVASLGRVVRSSFGLWGVSSSAFAHGGVWVAVRAALMRLLGDGTLSIHMVGVSSLSWESRMRAAQSGSGGDSSLPAGVEVTVLISGGESGDLQGTAQDVDAMVQDGRLMASVSDEMEGGVPLLAISSGGASAVEAAPQVALASPAGEGDTAGSGSEPLVSSGVLVGIVVAAVALVAVAAGVYVHRRRQAAGSARGHAQRESHAGIVMTDQSVMSPLGGAQASSPRASVVGGSNPVQSSAARMKRIRHLQQQSQA